MARNPLLKVYVEDAEMNAEQPQQDMDMSGSNSQTPEFNSENMTAAMEEVETYLGLAEHLQDEISQNEVNIATIVGGEVPKAILSPDGEFLANVNTEISPTIDKSDDLDKIIPLEIADQNNRILQNAAGQLNYVEDNRLEELKEEFDVKQDYITMEHARISPLHMFRVHTEGLKEFFGKIIEKIKEIINWIQSKLKNIGHDLLLVFEEIFKVRDGLIKKFKEGSDKEKRLKEGAKFSNSTVLTMLTDFPANLDTAINLQLNVLQPYTKQFIEAYQKKDDMRLDTLMKKAREDLLAKKNKDGENFLTKLGIKNTEGFICIVRPGQILKLDLSGDMWSVAREDVEVPEDVLDKLMKQVKVDVLWDDALEYLGSLDKVDRVCKDFIKLLNTGVHGDSAFIDQVYKDGETNLISKLKFYLNITKFKQTILTCVISTPRAIYSACKDIYKNVEIKQPDGDYSVMTLPKPATESFLGFFKKRTQVLSKIDYDATASNLSRNYGYSGNDLKNIIDFNTVFEDEAFEIIGRNNEGFSPEYDSDSLMDALSALKESMPIEANIIAKKIKVLNDFTPVKVLDKEQMEREYSLELFDKSIKYYESDCIGSCKESLKEAESNKADSKFIANLKEYIKLSQRAVDEAKETINILKKNFKFEEVKN